MKNIITKSLVACVLFVATSCDFGDTNINPALPDDVGIPAIVPAAQAGLSFAVGGEFVRINGLFMQQFNGINAQQADNVKYLVKSSDMDGVWRRSYHNSLNPFITILRKAEATDAAHYAAMSKILIATTLGTLTDGFGEVPYSDGLAALDGNFFPEYDSQQDIYSTIHRLLNEAITALQGPNGSGPAIGADDLIYGGDVSLWIKAAHALKAKYFLHMSKADANAYTDALGELSAAVSSNSEDFQFVFGQAPNEANPQYQFSQDRGGNIEIGQFFFDLLNNQNDPRRSALLKADADQVSGFSKEFNTGTFYSTINSPVIFVSYAELKFIEAEALLMEGDPVNAEIALQEAVTASLQKITGSTDAAYVATYASFTGLTTQAERLERIITEKYIGLYSHGLESWVDFRRTGYPALTPHPQGSNTFNLNGEIPRRFPYPQTEIDLNENVPSISPDLQDRFFWDQ